MARKKSPTPTDAELRLMNVLWERGASTVSDVSAALPKKLGLAYSTVLTTLRILEQKGYLRHQQNGRAFVYRPVIDKGQVRRSAVKYIMSRFFQNSPELLVLNVLEHEKLSPEEVKRLRELIDGGD